MNDLPQELIDEICSHLPRDDLQDVLTLSRQFQYSAEKYSGFFEKYTLDTGNSAEFRSRFLSYRLLYLQEVIFRPTVPRFNWRGEDGEPVPYRETADEVRRRDESFTNQIQWLFHVFRSIEDQAGEMGIVGRY
ncbi:hypothetical protein COCMIDRAFT_6528 [Bipolaris oryzae ATCC 44560]|uniref:F-box domain-containing protein n=1 Tax=Bipolaris oryzae ATCC 44560 TaxID=930090 RepID=W6Z981_COCMI|nr:uncharacterized protein COCMIDRAFT_6528 [Bipolaris oryzae ATCC 44560]EUC44119.1 hypothetical protein COCMIDRAFT_6528 [Bipolaris oryzae ATCC 44560]